MIICLLCLSLNVWCWMFAFDVWIGDVPSWPVRFMPRPRSNVIIAIRPITALLNVHAYEVARGIIARTFCLWRAIPDQKASVHKSRQTLLRMSFPNGWSSLSPIFTELYETSLTDRVFRQSYRAYYTSLPPKVIWVAILAYVFLAFWILQIPNLFLFIY